MKRIALDEQQNSFIIFEYWVTAGCTWALWQIAGLLLVRASRAGMFDALSMTGLCGWEESIGAGLSAGTPQRPGREAIVFVFKQRRKIFKQENHNDMHNAEKTNSSYK